MVFETCQSKCLSRWQVPVTLLATREQGSFHAEILWVSQTNYVFVFAGKWDSSRGVAGTRLAWCWGLSAFQSQRTERGPLASVWWQKKKMKMRQRLRYSNLCLSQAGVLCHKGDYPCLSIQTLPPAWWLIYPHLTDLYDIATSELLWN